MPGWQRLVAQYLNPVLQGFPFTRMDSAPSPAADWQGYLDDVKGAIGLFDGADWHYTVMADDAGDLVLDNDLTVPGDLAVTGTGTFTGKIGYAGGGSVTQLTSKATGVTLDELTGDITMNAAALAAGVNVSFVLTSNKIAAGDVMILNHISGGTLGAYHLNGRCAAGSATIDVRNLTAGSLSEAIVLRFAVLA